MAEYWHSPARLHFPLSCDFMAVWQSDTEIPAPPHSLCLLQAVWAAQNPSSPSNPRAPAALLPAPRCRLCFPHGTPGAAPWHGDSDLSPVLVSRAVTLSQPSIPSPGRDRNASQALPSAPALPNPTSTNSRLNIQLFLFWLQERSFFTNSLIFHKQCCSRWKWAWARWGCPSTHPPPANSSSSSKGTCQPQAEESQSCSVQQKGVWGRRDHWDTLEAGIIWCHSASTSPFRQGGRELNTC